MGAMSERQRQVVRKQMSGKPDLFRSQRGVLLRKYCWNETLNKGISWSRVGREENAGGGGRNVLSEQKNWKNKALSCYEQKIPLLVCFVVGLRYGRASCKILLAPVASCVDGSLFQQHQWFSISFLQSQAWVWEGTVDSSVDIWKLVPSGFSHIHLVQVTHLTCTCPLLCNEL